MNNVIKGKGCFKFHQISIADKIEDSPILFQNQEIELIQSESKLSLRVSLDVIDLDFKEVWEVGVSESFNSSENLEPFDLEIIRVSLLEFIIRISATCNKSNCDDNIFTLELFSKFSTVLPKQFMALDSFYDLA